METTTTPIISAAAKQTAAEKLHCKPDELNILAVSGGYSLNRRALLGHHNKWVFAKEVDKSVLAGDGSEELEWLQKDFDVTTVLRTQMPDIIPEWSSLSEDKHVLLMPSYRIEDGWLWTVPDDKAIRHDYVQAVINATKKLEVASFNTTETDHINLAPYFRDKLALDDGLELISRNPSLREQLDHKYALLQQIKTSEWLQKAYDNMRQLLQNPDRLNVIAMRAAKLIEQPNDCFNHCDVRSDNVTYNPLTRQIKFVDWNWASYAPSKFGSTEFLIDMARRGVDISPWTTDLNPELLAATIGVYAKSCLKDPLSSESTLREMQADSAAIALTLYDMVNKRAN